MNMTVVLIPDALTGIARAALAFARKGPRILASDRHDDAVAALVAGLCATERGSRVRPRRYA